MVCTNCGAQGAKEYISHTAEGDKKAVLCPKCYRLLYGEAQGGSQKYCPVCGTSFADYRRTGLLGCSHCYTAFREELFPIIYRLQGSLKHCGVVPAETAAEKYDDVRRLAYEQEELLQQITAAKGAGDRLREAELRRKLAVLNRKLYGGDTV